MFKLKKQGLLQAILTLLAGRGVQIVLGFAHLIVVLYIFGGRDRTDVYFLAYSLFILATMIAIQSLTFTFVPVFTDWRKQRGEREAWELASTVLNLSVLVLVPLSALIWLAAPWIARALGPGFAGQPEKMELLTTLLRILSPVLIFTALAAVPRALYASYQSFVLPAVTALFLEVGLIVGALAGSSPLGLRAPMIGGVVGVALQAGLLVSIVVTRRELYRPSIRLRHEGLRQFGSLFAIRVFGIVTSQINLLVDRGMSTLAEGDGNVTALVTSFKIANLIPQILIWGVCEAIIAVLSSAWAEKNVTKIHRLMERGIKFLIFLTVPGAVVLIVTRTPLIALLFQHHNFTADDTAHAALPLLFYSFNLPFAVINMLLLTALWAIQDNWSVLKLALVGLVINISSDFILLHLVGYAGIALANLPRGIVLLVLATAIFNRRVTRLDVRAMTSAALRVTLAGCGAYLAATACMRLLGTGQSFVDRLTLVAVGSVVTGVVYLGLCRILAAGEVKGAVEFVRNRLNKKARSPSGKGGAEKNTGTGSS